MNTIETFIDLDRRQLAQRLKATRELRGLTLDQVAWRAELTPHTYRRMEHEGTGMLALTLYKVCMVLRVSADWLLGLPEALPPARSDHDGAV